MTRVRILREAQEDLRAAARFYETEQSGLGQALINEVRRAYRRIAEQPLASRLERRDIRVRAVPRFPYRIYFRARPDEILIVAIGHRRRRPGFWRGRV
jgi:plasmid stabilization system protein ParE